METLVITKEEEALQCRMAAEVRLQEMGVEVLTSEERMDGNVYIVIFKLCEKFMLYHSAHWYCEGLDDFDMRYLFEGPCWTLLDSEVSVREFDRILDPDLPEIGRPVKYSGKLAEMVKLQQRLAKELI